MIRIHQVWPFFPLDEELDKGAANALLLRREEVYAMFLKFDETIEVTLEDGGTKREDADKLRASANYVMYMLDPMALNPKALIDLTIDLANRPKRTVMVLCRFSPNDFMNPAVEDAIQHLLKIFGSSDLQYCDRFHELLGFLEERQPQKSTEVQT